MRRLHQGIAVSFFALAALAGSGCSKPEDKPKTVTLPDRVEFRNAPDPIADRLMGAYKEDTDKFADAVLNREYVPAKDMTECFSQYREARLAFSILALAKMNDVMSNVEIPGYNSYTLHDLSYDVLWPKAEERLEQRRQECIKSVPAAGPDFKIAPDHNNAEVMRVYGEIFSAAGRMGQGMTDYVELKGPEEIKDRQTYLSEFCRTMWSADAILLKIPPATEARWEADHKRFRDGLNKVCAGGKGPG